jgi:subtilisin family serine protease
MSTEPEDQYQLLDGTSMASPHAAGVVAGVAAGVVALVWSHFLSCTNTHIRNVLVEMLLANWTRTTVTRFTAMASFKPKRRKRRTTCYPPMAVKQEGLKTLV